MDYNESQMMDDHTRKEKKVFVAPIAVIETRDEFIEQQLSLVNRACDAIGCDNRAQTYKTFFKAVHMEGYDNKGLQVRTRINICTDCDEKLHGPHE